jgi:sulfur transfer complex TusBCD TusB component (DsrH family)
MDESTYADECNHGNTATSSSHDVGAKNASDPCSHSLPVIHVDKVIDLYEKHLQNKVSKHFPGLFHQLTTLCS